MNKSNFQSQLPTNHKYNIATFPTLQLNFWAIPRCGSSTIKHILLRADNPSKFNTLSRGRATGSDTKNWAHGKCKHITPEQTRPHPMGNGYKNFAVLRDPIDRVYSMYSSLDRLGDDMDGGDYFKKDIKNFYKNRNVLDFVKLLGRHQDEERNIHFRSQKYYCRFDNIVKLSLPNISSTIQQIHPSLVVDVQIATIKHFATRDEADEAIIDQIHQVFEKDFELWSNVE